MTRTNHLRKIEDLISEQRPAPIGRYTLYAENNTIKLEASKHTKNKEAVIARLTSQEINHGLASLQWCAIIIKVIEFMEVKIL